MFLEFLLWLLWFHPLIIDIRSTVDWMCFSVHELLHQISWMKGNSWPKSTGVSFTDITDRLYCHIYTSTIEWNSCLCISQLVRKLRSGCRLNHDTLPCGASAMVKGTTVYLWKSWDLNSHSFADYIWTLTTDSSLIRIWSITLGSC